MFPYRVSVGKPASTETNARIGGKRMQNAPQQSTIRICFPAWRRSSIDARKANNSLVNTNSNGNKKEEYAILTRKSWVKGGKMEPGAREGSTERSWLVGRNNPGTTYARNNGDNFEDNFVIEQRPEGGQWVYSTGHGTAASSLRLCDVSTTTTAAWFDKRDLDLIPHKCLVTGPKGSTAKAATTESG